VRARGCCDIRVVSTMMNAAAWFGT